MAKDNFSWKSLFINEETQEDKKESTNTSASIMPQDTTKFPETSVGGNLNSSTNSNNPFLNEILEVYQKGFESLNHEGFDFFELYKSVNAVGVTNPQSYQMAFAMGKTISPQITKEYLLEKSKFYISEIEKVYTKYDATGNQKNKDLNQKITSEKATLSKTISEIEANIAQLQTELAARKQELERIDIANKEQFSEIQLKIEANNLAKQKILDSINTVVTGINQYL